MHLGNSNPQEFDSLGKTPVKYPLRHAQDIGGLLKNKMEPSDLGKLALLALCLVLSAFFSSSETAFIAFPRSRLVHLVSIGHRRAMLVSQLMQRPERLLATVLLGNNLANTAAAALGTALTISLLGNSTVAVLVATLGVTTLLLVFSETLPKTVAWNRSEGVAYAFAPPLAAVAWALTPVTWGLQGLAKSFTKLFGITGPTSQVSEQEIRSLIAVGAKTGEVEASEAALLEKVFRFGDQHVMDVMTPRPEIVWVEHGATLEQFLTIFAQHRHSRFPVFHESTENIKGVLSVKDILLGLGEGKLLAEDSVTDVLRTAHFVPETKPVSDTFEEMQRGGHGMVLTVDEFGGIAGLATLEQLLEVIVGEVDEEGGSPGGPYTTVAQDTFLLDASVGIAEINDQLALNLPEGQYQTVAGFVLDRLGRIPQVGDAVEFQDLRLTVTAMERVKIAAVEVRRTRPEDKTET